MPRLVQLVKAYFKLAAQQTPRILGRAAKDLLHTHEVRLLVTDDARIGRDGYLARGEGVEGVDGLVARLVVRYMDHYLDLVGRQIVHLLDTYLAPLVGLHDRILYRLRGRGKGYLRNGERPFVDLRDTRPHLDRATAQAVVVARHIHDTARREIGIQLEILPAKVCDTCVNQLVEVMRQDLGRQTYGNTVGALRQQQRELDRKCHGLLVAAIVGAHPLRGLAVEDNLQGKLRQPSLDISARGSLVAREYVAPVTLTIYQQVLLSELHQRILDRGVTVRVVLHGLSHNIGDLVVAAVVAALHGVQDAALHGLQAILQMGYGTLQNHIRRVVQEPVLVHARQFVYVAAVLTEKPPVASCPGLRRLFGRHVDRQLVAPDLLVVSRISIFCHLR